MPKFPFHKDESSLKVNRVHDYIAAVRKGLARAPKGKLPYIDDDGTAPSKDALPHFFDRPGTCLLFRPESPVEIEAVFFLNV